MKELANHIKSRKFSSLYLLFGQEAYLVRLYESRLREAIIGAPGSTAEAMNLDIFEGKNVSAEQVDLRANTLPFMNEKRLLIIRDSGLFAPGRKDESERIYRFFENLPPDAVTIFIESNVDKRSKTYKQALKSGTVTEFTTPTDKDLVVWLTRTLKDQGKAISASDALLLLRYTSYDMHTAAREALKLAAYMGDAPSVTAAHIEAVCVKSTQARIFDLVDAVAIRDAALALSQLDNMLAAKESPLMILSMIARQFRIMLMCKECNRLGLNLEDTVAATGLRGFMVSAALRQAKPFTQAALVGALHNCADIDHRIKTGRITDRLALELLIITHCNTQV